MRPDCDASKAEENDVGLMCLFSEKCRLSLMGQDRDGHIWSFDVIWYLRRNSCMMMIMLYIGSLLSQFHAAGANRATRSGDVVEVTAYFEVSRIIDIIKCSITPLPVSSGRGKASTSPWRLPGSHHLLSRPCPPSLTGLVQTGEIVRMMYLKWGLSLKCGRSL
jgi:hypothetical protein